MIRRGFWLTVGAAGGIVGYRRVSALSRQVAQTLGGRPAGPPGPGRDRHWGRDALRFTRDVREGMDIYIARQQRGSAPTLGPGTSGKSNSYRTDHDKREDH